MIITYITYKIAIVKLRHFKLLALLTFRQSFAGKLCIFGLPARPPNDIIVFKPCPNSVKANQI